MAIPRRPVAPPLLAGMIVTGLLLTLSCEHDPVGVDAFRGSPCTLPPLSVAYESVEVEGLAVRAALADAARRGMSGLERREHAEDLTHALEHLAAHLEHGAADGNCRMLHLAIDALETHGSASERPDRASIEIVLHLTNAALRVE